MGVSIGYYQVVDLFPYKLEIWNFIAMALKEYESIKKVPMMYLGRQEEYLQAFQLMFYTYQNKHLIWSKLERIGKDYYTHSPGYKGLHYLESLPTVLFSSHVYSQKEKELVGDLGFRYDFNENDYVYKRTIELLKWNLMINELV